KTVASLSPRPTAHALTTLLATYQCLLKPCQFSLEEIIFQLKDQKAQLTAHQAGPDRPTETAASLTRLETQLQYQLDLAQQRLATLPHPQSPVPEVSNKPFFLQRQLDLSHAIGLLRSKLPRVPDPSQLDQYRE